MNVRKLISVFIIGLFFSLITVGCGSFEEAGEDMDDGVEAVGDELEEAGDEAEEELDEID